VSRSHSPSTLSVSRPPAVSTLAATPDISLAFARTSPGLSPAGAATDANRVSFFAPRSSSLLPPPQVILRPNTAASQRPDREAEGFLDPSSVPPRPATSQSSIKTPVSDSFRNLNRWSTSTTESRTPPRHTRPRANDEANYSPASDVSPRTRRKSLDGVALAARQADSASNTPPRKIGRQRQPSIDTGNSSPSPKQRRISPPPQLLREPPPNLPPIIALSPLVDTSVALRSESSLSLNRPTPSPVVSTPNSVFSSQLHGKSSAQFWDAIADRETSPARANPEPPTLLPPAPVVPDTMPGHTRNRSSTAKGSTDSTKSRTKPSQKAMLSKALAKANTAVQLDNAQNYEGARESYTEACNLLQQVLARTTGEEDRKKLEAIVSIGERGWADTSRS
jgi:hypothetical protein